MAKRPIKLSTRSSRTPASAPCTRPREKKLRDTFSIPPLSTSWYTSAAEIRGTPPPIRVVSPASVEKSSRHRPASRFTQSPSFSSSCPAQASTRASMVRITAAVVSAGDSTPRSVPRIDERRLSRAAVQAGETGGVAEHDTEGRRELCTPRWADRLVPAAGDRRGTPPGRKADSIVPKTDDQRGGERM